VANSCSRSFEQILPRSLLHIGTPCYLTEKIVVVRSSNELPFAERKETKRGGPDCCQWLMLPRSQKSFRQECQIHTWHPSQTVTCFKRNNFSQKPDCEILQQQTFASERSQ
jgi:hypothetical protein